MEKLILESGQIFIKTYHGYTLITIHLDQMHIIFELTSKLLSYV